MTKPVGLLLSWRHEPYYFNDNIIMKLLVTKEHIYRVVYRIKVEGDLSNSTRRANEDVKLYGPQLCPCTTDRQPQTLLHPSQLTLLSAAV